MEHEGSFPCPQGPATGPYIDPDATSPHPASFSPKIYSTIIFPSTPRSSKCSLPFRSPNRNILCIYHFSHACYIPLPLRPPWFDHPNNLWWSSSLSNDNEQQQNCIRKNSGLYLGRVCHMKHTHRIRGLLLFDSPDYRNRPIARFIASISLRTRVYPKVSGLSRWRNKQQQTLVEK